MRVAAQPVLFLQKTENVLQSFKIMRTSAEFFSFKSKRVCSGFGADTTENGPSRVYASAAAEAEYVLKKTENRVILSVSGLGPSTNGKDLEKRNLENSKTQTNKKRTRMKDDTEIERCN